MIKSKISFRQANCPQGFQYQDKNGLQPYSKSYSFGAIKLRKNERNKMVDIHIYMPKGIEWTFFEVFLYGHIRNCLAASENLFKNYLESNNQLLQSIQMRLFKR